MIKIEDKHEMRMIRQNPHADKREKEEKINTEGPHRRKEEEHPRYCSERRGCRSNRQPSPCLPTPFL